MTIVLRLVAAALAGVALSPLAALAGGASPWVEGFHSRIRLVAGNAKGAERWVGIEVALDPGFKTYWREPGESGLPPRFDWAGSTNAATIDLRWPAPTRTEDAGGVAYTYGKRVVFPVRVEASDPGEPAALRLNIEYGVCKEICIPAHAALELAVGPRGGPHAALIQEALARVPRSQPLGAEGALSITAVERVPGGKPAYRVQVRSPEGAMLFAEAPANWFVATSAMEPGGRFTVTVEEKPRDAAGPLPLRLTLVAGEQAVETEVRLDEPDASR